MNKTSLPIALTIVAAIGCGSDESWISSTPAQLTQYPSCSALESDLKGKLIADINARYEQIKAGGGFGGGPAEAGTDDEASGSNDGGRQEGVDYSGTNNQEDGVDEADFVKTDGYHVYTLSGSQLHIFGVPEFGDLEPLSVTDVEGYPRQMVVDKDAERLVVFSNIYPWSLPEEHPLHALIGEAQDEYGWMWRVNGLSKMTVLDISNREEPTLEREIFVEGSYQTARLADGSVRVGSYAWINVAGHYGWEWQYYGQEDGSLEAARDTAIASVSSTPLGELVPRIHERLPSGDLTTHALTTGACAGYYRPGDSSGRGFTSLISMDLSKNTLSFDADHVVSNWSTIYASKDNLFIAEQAHDWWWWWGTESEPEFATNLHQFDISAPGQAFYRGSGRVPGLINNQFSLSEHEGKLRVATTTNPWNWGWGDEEPTPSENHVWVLSQQAGALNVIGHVGGIAPGETIFATRFLGDKGYVVTFERVDPLFTIDLSNPANPTVVGELEIPGFSTYLHPLGDDHLLGIGVGGDENGANWQTQISLFDVSDFADPKLDKALPISMEDGWSWSEAQWDHKAFQYWGPEQLLAVPVSSYGHLSTGDYTYISNLELISVDPDSESGLASFGTIDHSDFFNSDPNTYWDYRDIRRSIFMGDYVYAISDRGITVHELAGLGMVNSSPLPGYTGDYYWWW